MDSAVGQDLKVKRLKMYNPDGTINSNFVDSEPTQQEIIDYTRKILNKKYKLDIPTEIVERIQKIKQDEKMIEHLRQRIFLEAKARYEQEQSGKTEDNTWNIS